MTQQLDPTFVPQQRTADPAAQGRPEQGWPTATVQNPGYPPGDPGVATPYAGAPYTGAPYTGTPYSGTPYSGTPYASTPYYGPAPAGYGVEQHRSGSGKLWIIVSAVVGVVVVLAGVLGWVLLAPAHQAPAATQAPATSQPAASPAAPSEESPAVAAAARGQLSAALDRYNQAAQRFSQQAKTSARTGDKNGMRTAITDFRAATYGYDADIRAITFPNAQQTVVNTQLLPATGRLVTDLDQFANLDPATIDATGNRVMADLQTSMSLTQQVMSGLGG